MCEFDLYEYYPAQYLKFWEGNWTEPILRYDRYIFNRDDEGFLSKYIRIPMSEEKMNLETEICSHGYKVLAKRK